MISFPEPILVDSKREASIAAVACPPRLALPYAVSLM
jgi:hypothetical protein